MKYTGLSETWGGACRRLWVFIVCAFLIALLSSCGGARGKGEESGSDGRAESENTSGESGENESENGETENVTEWQTDSNGNVVIPEPDSEAKNALIISKVYAPGGNSDAPVGCGFIELYNLSGREISLDGISLYYGEGKSFSRYDFKGVSIGGGKHLLIK